MLIMRQLTKYIEDILGINILPIPLKRDRLGKLPVYLAQRYQFYTADLMGKPVLLAKVKQENELGILQISKHKALIEKIIGQNVVFIIEHLPAFNRKRLIEKHISFVVPGRQLYIPEMMMDLRETFVRNKTRQEREKLLPTSQFLLLYQILHHGNDNSIENFSFKALAERLGYTPMAISKAVENLKSHQLIEVHGSKEKQIHFSKQRGELWNTLEHQNLWINPVIKQVFVDQLPKQATLRSNTSALPEYTDMNPSRQKYYAIEKTAYYALQRSNKLDNANEYEGTYCLELWKYNPLQLTQQLDKNKKVVDPLSLYLSLKDEQDERIEMALNQIIEKYIW